MEYIELLKEGHGAATFAFASGAGTASLFKVIEWLFIITGAMTVAYMTKLFIVLFVEKNSEAETGGRILRQPFRKRKFRPLYARNAQKRRLRTRPWSRKG